MAGLTAARHWSQESDRWSHSEASVKLKDNDETGRSKAGAGGLPWKQGADSHDQVSGHQHDHLRVPGRGCPPIQ